MKSAYYKVPSCGDGAGDNCEWGGAGLSVAQFSSSSQLIKTHNLSNGSQITCWILVVGGMIRINASKINWQYISLPVVISCLWGIFRSITLTPVGWARPFVPDPCFEVKISFHRLLIFACYALCALYLAGSLLNEPCKGFLHSNSLPLVGLLYTVPGFD